MSDEILTIGDVRKSRLSELDNMIRAETGGKLRSFLYELAEGVTTYRTVHSLTEQVEHQYHGRFAIELIQNAYDAINRVSCLRDSPRRIEMRLVMDDTFGTLYVANDGAPFSHSNFESVSRLGQSDKDPATSIGNKGIGFRSVLEISHKPRIWSRLSGKSSGFDGYCFGFDPGLVTSIFDPALSILEDRALSVSQSWFGEIVDEDASLRDRLRTGVRRRTAVGEHGVADWLREQIGYLSPYLLPWPLSDRERNRMVEDLEARGFATVLALPLLSTAATTLVERKLAEIDADSMLFLDNLKELTIATLGGSRTFRRSVAQPATGPRHFGQVAVGSASDIRRFHVWRRQILVSDMPEVVQDSIRGLPGHWPKLDRVEITIAVSNGIEPAPGKLSIFLPTALETGASLHVNAPFFGDMSRTTISFETEAEGAQAGGTYNDFLLHQAAVLALEAITQDLLGRSATEAASIVDILSPHAIENTAIARWQDHLRRATADLGVSIPNAPWMLSDRGWRALSETSLLPLPDNPGVLTAPVMREHAAFPAYVAELDSRTESIGRLSDHFKISVLPAWEDQAATIESAAKALSASPDLRWDHFWEDVSEILRNDLSPLKGKEVLLCTDGTLHSGGVEGRAIYFRPRQTGQDEDELDERAIDQVPAALQPFIAVLNPRVPVTEVRDGRRQNTSLHKQLTDAGLVSQFRREEVLSDILIPNLPPMPVEHGAPEAALCRDALSYALRLAQSMEARGDGQGLLRAMAKVPVPCRGGWFPLSAAIFGRGWLGTQGAIVDRYLRLAGTDSAKVMRKRLLHGPEHPGWGGLGANSHETLDISGVRDGLPLIVIGGKEPALSCDLVHYRFHMPLVGPTPIDDAAWTAFRTQVSALTSAYKSGRYKVERLYWLPGLENHAAFDNETRQAFLDVALGNAPRWTENWLEAILTRDTGTYEVRSTPSPLFLALSTFEWIPAGEENGDQVWSKPAGRWYVPSRYTAGGRTWTFEHLSPLPEMIASRLEHNDALRSFFTALGVAAYESEGTSGDLRLLDRLGEAVERRSFRNDSILVGQLRGAWEVFQPAAVDAFPSRVVVQKADGSLALVKPSEDSPVYLPSSRSPTTALRDLGLSVIAIEPKAAQRLADGFASNHGSGVRNSERFELVALSSDLPWTDEAAQQLQTFGDLDGVIPFVLTMAAFHGTNAQGTMSGSFNDMVRNFREARVAVLPNLAIVPMIGDQRIAAPRCQTAAWLARRRVLALDTGWKDDIQAVADALSQLIGRSDLRFPIRKGLSEIWPSEEDLAPDGILRQLDLTPEHFREVLELWRGDLGPVIARLSMLLRVLSREDLAARLEGSEQREQLIMVLTDAFQSGELAQDILNAAVTARDIVQFGSEAREQLGAQVELSEWNRELARRGESYLTNPQYEKQFLRHRERMLPVLRRIVAALAALTPEAPSYAEMMKRIDALRCPPAAAEAYWDLPVSEVAKIVSQDMDKAGFILDINVLVDVLSSVDPMLAATGLTLEIATKDPAETASCNRRLLEQVRSQFKLIVTAWHAALAEDESSSWLVGLSGDPAESHRHEDRDIFTHTWNEARVMEFILADLPATAPQEIRGRMSMAKSLDELMIALLVHPAQIEGAQDRLSALQAEAERRKRLIQVCGADIENSESGLAGLFAHIAAQIPDESVHALDGFDVASVFLPQKARKSTPGRRQDQDKRTLAPRKTRKNIEDLVGAAGEIHAFRWLQLKYGSGVITPSNWVSAYSANAFPDNAAYVDEGRGCDVHFTVDGCTFNIEIKSSEEDGTGFTLGTSEVRRAREIALKGRKKPREEFFILKVDHVLTPEPSFTLLPNPYDPRYQDRFVIIDEGARVSYR